MEVYQQPLPQHAHVGTTSNNNNNPTISIADELAIQLTQ